MATLVELTDEIAVRFDLGLKARALVQEVSALIAAQPGGIGGFLDKFKAAGLEAKAASWLEGPYPMALSVREVKQALGDEVIEKIAENTGITRGVASRVLGDAIPKIIGLLTADGAIAEAIPPAKLSFPGSARQFSPLRAEDFTAGLRLVVPGAALLITLGLFGYAISSSTSGESALIQSAPSVAQNAPVASPQTPAMPSHLPFGTETVATGVNPGATTGSLKPLLRTGKITGDLAIEAGWIKNLSAALDSFRGQEPQTLFAGNEFNAGGTIPHADRAWMIGSLQSIQVPQFVVADLTGSGAALMRIASSTPKLGSSGNDSVSLLNQAALDFPAITFPVNSAKVSSSSIPLLRRVAEQIKRLPPGSVVQLNGYTDSSGAPAANEELSQRRADSVYGLLVREGVSPSMMSAKGYGFLPSLDSINGIMEGRSSKITGERGPQRDGRRVEFRVIQQRP